MFSIDLPLWLGDIIGVLAGGAWPKENEGDFAAVSDIWGETAAALGGFSEELNNSKRTMQEGLSGPTAEQFGAFIDNLQSALPQMQQGGQALSQLAMEVAENIQYAKLMMLSMLVVTAATIAELAASVFGSAAIPAVEAAAEAAIESIASQLLKQVLKSAAEAALIGTAIDTGIQLFQHLKYGKQWNWKQTVETAGLGALGGALGGAMGIGAIRGLGEDIGNSLISHMIQGAINGAVVTEIANEINGGDANVGLGAAGGAIGGALGHAAAKAGANSSKLDPKPGGYDFKAPDFGDEKPGGEFGGGLNGGRLNSGDDEPGKGPDAFSFDGGSDGVSINRGSINEGSVNEGSVNGGSVNEGSANGGSFRGGSVDDDSDGVSIDDASSFDADPDTVSIDSRADGTISQGPDLSGSTGNGHGLPGFETETQTPVVAREGDGDGTERVAEFATPRSSAPVALHDSMTDGPQRTFEQPLSTPSGLGLGLYRERDPEPQPGEFSDEDDAHSFDDGRSDLESEPPPTVRTLDNVHRPVVTESSVPRPQAASLHSAPEPEAPPRSTHSHSETPPVERGVVPGGGHGEFPQHHQGAPTTVHLEVPASSDHTAPTGPSRYERWEDAKVEIQQQFTDRFDYTTKTERVADEAEDHFQEALTDRGIVRSRLGLDPEDLSQAGQQKVLGDFQADAKAAFDDRFGAPGDRYDTATDHVADFRGRLSSLARELPARFDREALWEQQRDLMRQRFDDAFDAHPVIAPRRELFGPRGEERAEAQKNEAWQRLEPELRSAFDETAAHPSSTDLASAVAARFDDIMRDQVPHGIALHDRLLTEVSAARAATGEAHSPADDAIEQRITSEFESVFGRPFAARSGDGRPHEDDFPPNDRWADLKLNQQTDWLPKALALDKELGSGFRDQFDTAVRTRAEPRAELGLNRERPTGNPEHGLTYDAPVGRASVTSGADGHDGTDTDVENPAAQAAGAEAKWLPGRDISDAGLDRVRSAFAGELADAFRDHFDGPLTGDRDLEDAWEGRRDALFADRLPKLLEYEAAFEHHLGVASRDFDESFENWEEDFAGGGHLEQDGLDRVRAKFDEDFRDAYDQVHRADPDRWAEVGGPERAWQLVSRKLLDGAGQRFESEQALVDEVRRAADRFDRLNGEFQVGDGHRQELGSAYRTETATRHDQVYGDGTRDVAAWLEHEKEHGDAFGGRLTDLSDQREAAAAEAARAETERAAAEEAARAAEAAGQQVHEAHEEPPPETGPEKLRRLTTENDEKLDGDVRQLALRWREQGHGDALIEQAAKSWTDTVRREFDHFHHGLADTGRIVLTGRWEEKYGDLVEIGGSDQWIGVHKQVGDAMKVLEDGLKQRTEQWSGARYADWQREQLADAGERLASRLRSELSMQLRYLQVGRVDSVSNDVRRQWTADAVTRGFDEVLTRLQQNIDTSPVLMASLAKLRTETVSALDAPGAGPARHFGEEDPRPDVSEASEVEQWQQARTRLDTKYAQRLDYLAKLEGKRPDADAIFTQILDAGRDRSREGDEEYERMLPDPEEFRQAFDQTFDETFAPASRAGSGGSGLATQLAEQRWHDRREQLQNTLVSKVRLAAKHAELTDQAARAEQETRERWTSTRTADQKIVDQALQEFRANQKRLFFGTYGRLDQSGRIDANAPHTYQNAYGSLVENLDKQLDAAVARDSAEKAASAKYDEAVNTWREARGPALSSFESGTTVATRYPPAPDAEFAPDPEARFEAAFSAEVASASARHLNQLRMEMIDASRSAEAHQASYAAAGRPRGAAAALKTKLDLEGHFVDAMPRLRDGIAEAVRSTEGLDERAAQSLLKSSIARADAAFQRVARSVGDAAAAERMLRQELDDVIAGTKAVAEFQAAVSEHVKGFGESSDDQLPAAAGARVVRWAYNSADAKFDQLLASDRHSGDARITALSRSLDETLTEIDDRLAFEAGVRKAISSASEKAASIAQENLRASHTALDPDSVQRLQLQHLTAAQKAADQAREDLTARHFDPEHTHQVIEEFDGTLRHLVDGVQQQVLVETKLTSALTEAGNGFAALTDAHDVPAKVFAGAAKDYRGEYVTSLIRTSRDKPLDAPSWLEHESASADRFGSALHAQVRELFVDPAWQRDEPDPREDESPWRKSTFSPEGPGAACVMVALSAHHQASSQTLGEWITCTMSGIIEAVEVHFTDGTDVPVKHKYADRMVVLRGADEAESPGLYYTADEWQAFILGVKEGEFDDMAAAGAAPSEGAQRVIALRDSKDPDGTKLILAIEAWSELLITIKAGERELPSDMRELLDERFH